MTTIYAVNDWIGADMNHAQYLNKPRFEEQKLAFSKLDCVILAIGGWSRTAARVHTIATYFEIMLLAQCFGFDDILAKAKTKIIDDAVNDTVIGLYKRDGRVITFCFEDERFDIEFRSDGVGYGTGLLCAKAEYHRQAILDEFCMDTIMEKTARLDPQTSESFHTYHGDGLTDLESIEVKKFKEIVEEYLGEKL
ncbi:hypothetical protein CZP2022_60 [Vibrio phage C-ZP2022]|nr:hypothetical protein [Vibrio phage vB_pir03]UKZ10783.1 hypothetical protein CZP2022_60 [Vibrio phage C-ZP2022]